METENSQKLFSVSITYNSKIRELSDGNRVIVCQTNFLLWVPPFLSYELWKQRIELSKLAIQTSSNILFSWIGLKPHLKYIGLIRILDLGWKLVAPVQIWISVDLQFPPNHCNLPTCQTPQCTY